MYRQPFAHIIHTLTHIHNYEKSELAFPDDSVGSSVSVDAWLSLSTNVKVKPDDVTLPNPQETCRAKVTVDASLASRPKLCNNCCTLMNSYSQLHNLMISKQRAYFYKYNL